ncbi:unnamed protein product, partial [Iphiclides podalirius]
MSDNEILTAAKAKAQILLTTKVRTTQQLNHGQHECIPQCVYRSAISSAAILARAAEPRRAASRGFAISPQQSALSAGDVRPGTYYVC